MLTRTARLSALVYFVLVAGFSTMPIAAQVVTFSGAVYQTTSSGSTPIQGAQVLLFNGSSWIGPSVTDSYGRFAFYKAASGNYLLRVMLNGKVVWNETVTVPGANHTVVLRI